MAGKSKDAPKAEKAAKQDKKTRFNSPMNVEDQKLFLQHMPIIASQKDKVATAVADLRNLYKKAKGDGFEKADFDIAAAIQTAEGEAKAKAKVARQLTIAKYCGKTLGGQLDLFLEPDRTPATENAYEEGKVAAMSHEPAKPGYDPSTEQHREYMRGYHDVQGVQVKDGIKAKDDVVAAVPPKKKAAAVKHTPEVPAELPTSGMRMNRSDYEREQKRVREANLAQAGAAEPMQGSAFKKKTPAATV